MFQLGVPHRETFSLPGGVILEEIARLFGTPSHCSIKEEVCRVVTVLFLAQVSQPIDSLSGLRERVDGLEIEVAMLRRERLSEDTSGEGETR